MKQKWFNVNRIGGISDGVFAIAMTLLVLNLKLPGMVEPLSKAAFITAIRGQLPHFISWIISFAILCRLWIAQHALLELGGKKSRGFTTLNFVFLGAVSFIPFPASLISEHSNQPLSVIIFSATYVIAGLALGGMLLELNKQSESADSDLAAKRSVRHIIIWISVVAILSCMLAVVAEPQLGVFVWILLPFSGVLMQRNKQSH